MSKISKLVALAGLSLCVTVATGQSLTFSTFLGGSGEDVTRDVAFDSDGNLYATGGSSENFPTTDGTSVHQGSGGTCGAHDAWLAKWDSAGNLLWATVLGGAGYDRTYSVEVNSTGVYVGGRAGNLFPTTSGTVQETFAGDSNQNTCYGPQDGFVAKFDFDGGLVWSTYLGDGGRGFIRDIDVGPSGSVYVAISEAQNNPHVTTGAYDTTFNGGAGDAVVLRLSSDGSRVLWGTYLGGSGLDLVTPSIRVHPTNGTVYVTGVTDSTDYPVTMGAHQPSFGGGSDDVALTGINADGASLLFSTYIGGTGFEEQETHSLAVSASRVYVTGLTTSADLATSPTAFQRTNSDLSAFVSGFELNGNHVATTYLGGSAQDGGEGLSIERGGAVVVTGFTRSANFPTTDSTYDSFGGDGFVTILSPDLDSVLFSAPLGGSADDETRANAMSVTNLLAVGGNTQSSNFPVTNGSNHSSPGGGITRGQDAHIGVLDVLAIRSGDVLPPSPPTQLAPE